MSDDQVASVGFVGLGTMGEPMALNLCRAGVPLVVWNRSPAKTEILGAAGAGVASSVDEVFARTRTVILMLRNAGAADEALGRDTPAFAARVRRRTVVLMGTTPAAYSLALSRDIEAAGGVYVEAPVSGQRKPAEAGQLLAMVAGDADAIERIRPLLAPMCREVISCGAVPQAQAVKLASNHYVATMLVALSETVHFARQEGLDLDLLSSMLRASPMSSDLMRMKLPKLVGSDFSVQASLGNMSDVLSILKESARQSGAATPVLDACAALCGEAMALDLEDADAIAIIRAIEARSAGSGGRTFAGPVPPRHPVNSDA